MWYFHNWKHKKSITIDHTKVGGDLTDYPLYIDLSLLGDDFWANVQNGGGDIRITTSNGTTECAREIVFCDTATKTGEVHAKIPSVSSSTNTIVYIYYGNASASDYAVGDPYGAQVVRNVFLVENGFSDIIPGSIVPQTSGSRNYYIDGTASGSVADAGYGWKTGNNGTWETYFDTTVKYHGKASLKLSTKGVASYLQIRSNKATTYYTTTGFALLPNTAYKVLFRMKTNYVSGDSNDGAFVNVSMSKSDGTFATTASANSTKIKITTDWTWYAVSFITSADCSFGHIEARIYGHSGDKTLIMDAWFDDVFVGITNLANTYYNNQNSPATFYDVGEQETFTLYSPFPPFFKS